MDKKTETLRLRISSELKEKFFAACNNVEETPSRVLHEYIKGFVKNEETEMLNNRYKDLLRRNEKWQSNTRQS